MSFRNRLAAFLYSRRNIAGSLLALGGLALFFAGLLSGPLWAPVVVGLYAIGYLLVPAEKPVDLNLDAGADAADVRARLDRLMVNLRGRVAEDIYVRVANISASIEATLAAAPTDLGTADPNVFLIRQTALDYLPAALSAYLALPRSFAEGSVAAGGLTPHDELRDQLRLMSDKMQEVADDLARHDTDRLLANGRFLAEKFGTSSLDVAAAPAVTVAGAPPGGTDVSVPDSAAVPADVAAAPPVAVEEPALEREHIR